jgi:hypothetical protein
MKPVMVDWSSLPFDLVRHVAACLLATNDIDYYMNMRAVCCCWRIAIADPCRRGSDAHLLIFHPRQWIMLDEESESENRLFVNVSTGRFLRLRLPLLRDHTVVSASDGLVILRESNHPHAACVLNPFTGSLIRFSVPIHPEHIKMNAVTGSEPGLLRYTCHDGDKIFRCADPTSNFFSVQLSHRGQCKVQSMVAYAGHVYAVDMEGSLFRIAGTVQHSYGELILKVKFLGKSTFFLVESAGDLLLVHDTHWGIFLIFRVDLELNMLEAVKSIGSRALFLGPRSLSVDADKLPSINGGCLYYKGSTGMFVRDLKDGRESWISRMMPPNHTESFSVRPKSLVQVLFFYCMFAPNVKYLMKYLYY